MRSESGNAQRLPVENEHFSPGDSVCLRQKGIKRVNHGVVSQLSVG